MSAMAKATQMTPRLLQTAFEEWDHGFSFSGPLAGR
jgi:hypothetical protein